jgi:DNA-binding response OmpR family regulator
MLDTATDATHATPSTPTPARRILVIDDSPLIREAVSLALATAGWEVLQAESGEQGIALAEGTRLDAILLDVVMPVMDGFEVAEQLHGRSSASGAPVVLLTARDRPEDRARFARLGVWGTIPKPFDVHALAGQLAALLGWPL